MPADPSPLQSATSRLNALHSTGPASAAGKAASACNAFRHGLRATTIQVGPEEAAALERLHASLARRWQPHDAAAEELVQTLAVLELKLARLDGLELRLTHRLDGGEPADAGLPSMATLQRYRASLQRERDAVERRLLEPPELRCTNEAEPERPAAAAPAATPPAGPPAKAHRHLNRHERRRLAAEARRTAMPLANPAAPS
ncbi:MAG: hypothetical protein U1E14_04370 [Geminicoccaceae bacterium]